MVTYDPRVHVELSLPYLHLISNAQDPKAITSA
jgi:hypothetical protein